MRTKKVRVHKVGLTYRQMLAVRNAAHVVRKDMVEKMEINREWESTSETESRARKISDLDIAVKKMTDILTDLVIRGAK